MCYVAVAEIIEIQRVLYLKASEMNCWVLAQSCIKNVGYSKQASFGYHSKLA